jgi:hypothetical protein
MELINTSIPILAMSKKDIKDEARFFVQSRRDVLPTMSLLLQAKKAEEYFKTIQEEIKADALKDAEKYPERVVEKYGAKFEKTSVYTTYDFSLCNDSELVELNKKQEEISKKVKDREEFLKGLKEPITILNEETGEVNKIYPPVKKTTDGLKITY